MKILTRRKGEGQWTLLDSQAYRNEAELHRLIADSPSIVPVDEIRDGAPPLVVAVRELGLPGSGHTDVIAFSEDGDTAVIECKLAANQESKRKVVGQILEYGAYLWGLSYEELDRRIIERCRANLADLVRGASEAAEWDEETFRINVRDALEKGRFALIVAVDEINEELGRTISFLNGCGKPSFSLHALEMRRFQKDGVEVLVPHLHGRQEHPPEKLTRKWTAEEFLEAADASVSPEVAAVVRDLYVWIRTIEPEQRFGTGRKTGAVICHVRRKDGRNVSIFSVWSNGIIQLNYDILRNISEDLVTSFHEAITKIPQFGKVPGDFSKWPTVKIADVFLADETALSRFKDAVRELGELLRK